jgi:hypothetical protein
MSAAAFPKLGPRRITGLTVGRFRAGLVVAATRETIGDRPWALVGLVGLFPALPRAVPTPAILPGRSPNTRLNAAGRRFAPNGSESSGGLGWIPLPCPLYPRSGNWYSSLGFSGTGLNPPTKGGGWSPGRSTEGG